MMDTIASAVDDSSAILDLLQVPKVYHHVSVTKAYLVRIEKLCRANMSKEAIVLLKSSRDTQSIVADDGHLTAEELSSVLETTIFNLFDYLETIDQSATASSVGWALESCLDLLDLLAVECRSAKQSNTLTVDVSSLRKQIQNISLMHRSFGKYVSPQNMTSEDYKMDLIKQFLKETPLSSNLDSHTEGKILR
jgi:hypothetical protein